MHLYTHEEVVAEVKPLKSRATVYFACKTRMMINTGQFSIVVKAALGFSVMRRMSCGALLTGIRWQGWPSGESTCLLPMWPGFDFPSRLHMWIEFVGSLLCSESFFPGNCGFPLSSKPNIRFDLIC